MKKILLLLTCTLLFCACSQEPSSVRDGRKIYTKYFRYVLKDPDSFKVYSEKYAIKESKDTKDYKENNYWVEWTLDYGAKNSYGAMVRKDVSFKTYKALMIMIDGELYTSGDLQ